MGRATQTHLQRHCGRRCAGAGGANGVLCFLALFPAILCVIALASFFPLKNFTDDMIASVGRFAPAEMLGLIREQMVRIAEGNHGGILSVGLLGALWSSSAALVAIIGAMNKAYDIDESRPWWKVRLLAIGLTIGLAIFIVVSFALVVAGPQLADWLAAKYASAACSSGRGKSCNGPWRSHWWRRASD